MNWTEADEKLGGRTSRKVDNNTYMERMPNGSIGIRLHNTYVVTIHRNGQYTLNSGGWQTVTTKDRINNFSPVRVYQKDFVWYVGDGQEFYDGMIVERDTVRV